MSGLETIQLSHVPKDYPVHVALYRDLNNAKFLREQLISGNAEFEYAFIDASMVLSRTHVLSAVFKAINSYLNRRLKSRNIHSEIVFSLSPNNNIAESFRKFGITDSTKDLLVVKVSVDPQITHDSVAQHLQSVVEGTPARFDDETLASIADIPKIRKAYKISAPQTKAGAAPAVNGDEKKGLEVAILGAMALQGAT